MKKVKAQRLERYNKYFKMEGEIDLSKTFSTGDVCPETGWYVCKYHPYIEKWVKKDDVFPDCHKVNCGHTEWHPFAKK